MKSVNSLENVHQALLRQSQFQDLKQLQRKEDVAHVPGHLSGNWVLGQPDVGMGTEKSQAVGTKQPQGEAGRARRRTERAAEMVEGVS